MVTLAVPPDELSTPAHEEKAYPVEAKAVNCTACPGENHIPAGLRTPVPPPAGDTPVSNRYCVVKFAVYVVPLVGATVWDIAPPSLQLLQIYWMPVPPLCGDAVAIGCLEPDTQVKVRPAV